MNKLSFFLLLIILTSMDLESQNLKKHQWNNRLVLVISNNTKSKLFINQIAELSINSTEFKNRKLAVYSVYPKQYKIENNENQTWINSSDLYKKYNPNDESFKVILIGLDGRIKLEKNHTLKKSKLFETIDAMPMRQAEVKTKQ